MFGWLLRPLIFMAGGERLSIDGGWLTNGNWCLTTSPWYEMHGIGRWRDWGPQLVDGLCLTSNGGFMPDNCADTCIHSMKKSQWISQNMHTLRDVFLLVLWNSDNLTIAKVQVDHAWRQVWIKHIDALHIIIVPHRSTSYLCIYFIVFLWD